MRRLALLLAVVLALPVSAQGWSKAAAGWTKISASSGGGSSLPPYTGHGGEVLAVNVGETATEWIAVAGTGTVTSVGITAPNIFAVTGSPITAAGTLALALADQNANLVWAGPATGAAAAPTFRALVALDLGSFTLSPSLRLLTLQDATGDTTPLTVRASGGAGTAPIAQFQTSANGALSNIGHDGVFNGNVVGNVTGNVSGTSGSTTGNAATATALATDPTACSAGQYVSDLAANGTLTCGTPAAGGVSDGDKGDVTVSGSGATWTIDAEAVTLAKIADAAASSKLLGSGDSGSGAPYAEITVGTGLAMTGTTLSATGGGGGITNSAGANVVTKSDGTNVVATALSETSAGVFATSAGTALSVTATAPAAGTGASKAGVGVSVTASPAVASTDTAGAAAGGGFTWTGGAAARNASGNADGGSFVYVGGAGIGTGKRGTFQAPGAGTDSLVLGPGAVGAGVNSVALGRFAITADGQGVAIGNTATTRYGSVAVGATSESVSGVAVGYGATTGTIGLVALGESATTGNNYSIVIGRASTATASNQFVMGSYVTSSLGFITDLYFGSGVTNTTGQVKPWTIRGTGGSGTDVSGGDTATASGKGTGAANPSLHRVYGDALGGTTGTTAHASVTRAVFNLSGKSLTSGAASSVFDVPLAASPSSGGGQVMYTIRATDGTEEQVASGTVNWVASRTGAGPTYAQSSTVVSETATGSSGALSTAWALVAGTNKMTMQVTPTSTTITPTLIEVVMEVHSQGRSDIVPIPF